MPTIRQFDASDNGLQTSGAVANAFENVARAQKSAGNEIGSTIGRGIGALGQPIQDIYDKTQVQAEISKGAASLAVFNDNLNKQWNGIANGADLNDSTVADKFRENALEPQLEKWVESFQTEKGQLWAETQANNLRQHYYEKTAADTATRSSLATKQNFDITVNSLAATASDPHSLDLSLGLASDTVDALVGSSTDLDPAQAAQLKTSLLQTSREQITQAGLTAMAQANPVQFKADLEAGKFDRYTGTMPPGFDKTLSAYVEGQIKAQAADDKAAKVAQDAADKDDAEGAVVDLFKGALQPDGTLAMPKDAYKTLMNDIAPMPGAQKNKELVTSTISALRAIQTDADNGTPAHDVPEVYDDFRQRAFLPASDPRHLTLSEVMQARADHKLGDKSFELYKQAVSSDVQDPGKVADAKYFDAFLNGYKPSLTNSTPFVPDNYGDQRYYQFQTDMKTAFDAGKAQGRSTSELLDPNGAYFILGKGATGLTRYLLKGDLHDPKTLENMLPGNAAPPLAPIVPLLGSPGESLDTFLQGFEPDRTITRSTSTIAPRQGNETFADYDKRTAGK